MHLFFPLFVKTVIFYGKQFLKMANYEVTDRSNKLFRFIVNFVYEELINQFINNNAECNSSAFWLINWNLISDKTVDGKIV